MVLILLFWLIIFDGIRQEQENIKFVKFYVPKIILIGIFWITGVVAFTWSQLRTLNDPTFTSTSQLPGFIFFQVLGVIAIIVYMFWLVYAVFLSCRNLKAYPYLGKRIKFFGVFTLAIVLLTIGGLIFGIVGDRYSSAVEFTLFFSVFNMYVFVVALMYSPSDEQKKPMDHQEVPMMRLVEEHENEKNQVELTEAK